MQHVVITGAAAGIGWALARAYWQQGCHVHLIDRDADALQARQDELQQRASIYAVDLLDDDAVADLCTLFIERELPVYRLINNAGITHRSPASTTDEAVFKRVMTLNWQVPVSLTRRLLPLLAEAGGKVINLSSMAALMPVPGRAAYCASKSALNQHFETWRPELKQQGIGLLMVFPSFVATTIEANALGKDGKPASHPQSRIGKQIGPDAMAQMIVRADGNNKSRLYSDSIAPRIGRMLWQSLPSLYERITWKKFKGELL